MNDERGTDSGRGSRSTRRTFLAATSVTVGAAAGCTDSESGDDANVVDPERMDDEDEAVSDEADESDEEVSDEADESDEDGSDDAASEIEDDTDDDSTDDSDTDDESTTADEDEAASDDESEPTEDGDDTADDDSDAEQTDETGSDDADDESAADDETPTDADEADDTGPEDESVDSEETGDSDADVDEVDDDVDDEDEETEDAGEGDDEAGDEADEDETDDDEADDEDEADEDDEDEAGGRTDLDHPSATNMDHSPVLGPEPTDGEATVIMFDDPSCPACAYFEATTFPDLRDHAEAGELSLVWRGMAVIEEWSGAALQVLWATYERDVDAFWALREHAFEIQDEIDDGEEAIDRLIDHLSSATSLDVEAIRADAENGTYEQRPAIDEDAGAQAGIDATPYFFLFRDGEFRTEIRGVEDYRVFASTLEL